jgi:phage-related protein
LRNAVAEKMTAAKQKIVDIWNQAKSFLEGINLYDIGVNIIQGLINGIGSMASAVAGKISDIAGGIKDKITGALGIHSPSRYMKWVGEMAGTGLIKGISSMIKPVATMAGKMAQATMVQPERAVLGFESDGFSDLRRSITVSNDSNKKQVEEETTPGNTIVHLEINDEVLGTAVIPHVNDSQDREMRTKMAVMGVL